MPQSTLFCIGGFCLGLWACGGPRATQGSSPQAVSVQTSSGVFFDDFSYVDRREMQRSGWVVRTAQGIPGPEGAGWWLDGVEFVDDAENPGNRLMRLTAVTAGDAASTWQTQVCHQRKYLRGTYAARVWFDNEPASGSDGDSVVETFYAIAPASEADFSEIDFEYLPNGGWGEEGETLWVTSWAPWGSVRRRPEDAEHNQDNTSDRERGDFEGWHTLLAQVTETEVTYFVDGEWFATHGGGYQPRAPLSLNFNLWFDPDGMIDSGEERRYVEHVDWVFYRADAVLASDEVEGTVARLRRVGESFRDAVPEWEPALPSLCDI